MLEYFTERRGIASRLKPYCGGFGVPQIVDAPCRSPRRSRGRVVCQICRLSRRQGYVPPNGRAWVDHIRTKGNEANHEIKLMSKADAEELIVFAEMLLKFMFEFPGRLPKAK